MTEPTHCEWVQRFLGPWQDGELDPAAAARIDTHLAACAGCAAHARFEAWFSAEIRRVADAPRAPERLADRVSAALRRAERNRRARRVITVIGGLAAAAGIAAVGVVTLRGVPSRVVSSSARDVVATAEPEGAGGAAPSSPPALPAPAHVDAPAGEADSLAADLIDRHERVAVRLAWPLELASGEPEAVSSWFRGKVAFPVSAPRFPGPEIRLVGGRLTHVRESDAAYLRYDAGTRPVSVLVFRPGSRPIWGDRVHDVMGRSVYTGRRGTLSYAVFRVGDLAYALTSDLPESALLDLAASIVGARRDDAAGAARPPGSAPPNL